MANSARVCSSQRSVHPGLIKFRSRHRQTVFGQPIKPGSRRDFSLMYRRWVYLGCCPIVMDSGCGTGTSTHYLATIYPECFVIGVDRSVHRTRKKLALPENAMIVQSDCLDIWRLARSANWKLKAHYWFYPNPWPKPRHVQRRWYAMPIFEDVIALGGVFECRTNWKLFSLELSTALAYSGIKHSCMKWSPALGITAHEAKYVSSRHDLWTVFADLH